MHKTPSRTDWRRILWGLPIVLAIWALALMVEQRQIETDLTDRAELAFRQAGIDWANVAVDGQNADLIGVAYSEQERNLARRLLARTWGIRGIDDRTSLAALEEHYVWTAAVDETAVRLMGFYPNGQARRNVLTVARKIFPERKVTDEMRPARGAPEDDIWLGAIEFGLAQLSRLQQGGTVNLRGTELAVAGVASSVGAYRSIKGALYRNVPAGVVLVKDKVEPPPVSPYRWSAEFKDGQLLLGGYVPSEADRGVLVDSAKEAFKQSPIVDKMAITAGAPKNWLAASVTVVRQLARLKEGKAELVDTKLDLSGVAQQEETAQATRNELRTGMATLYTIDARIKYLEAAVPTVSPFVTTINSDGRQVKFAGHYPGAAMLDKVTAAVRTAAPKRRIINELSLAKGAPKGWLNCVLAGLEAVLKLENGRVELTDRSLTITGLTKDETVGEELPKQVRAAANRDCTETINVRVEVPPEPNLKWRAETDEKTIRLSGEVPNSAIEKSLIALAGKLFPDKELTADMRVSPAQSKKWPRVAAVAMEQLSKLRSGVASIDNQRLTLRGEATDTAAATVIREQLKAGVVKGYTASSRIEVKSAAMLWAEREAKRKAEEAAQAAAKRRAEIEAQRRKAEEAARLKAEKEAAAQRAQQEEAQRKAAEAARRAREIAERQAAQAAARKAREEEQQRKAAEAARLAKVRQRERCQQAFDGALREGTIVFERGSATIQEGSFPTLKRIAALAGMCGSARIEIAGHTDSSGSADRNLDLSERRAASVRAYLVANGMLAERIFAKGYGETNPLVPNTSSANRARNRRIEFKVTVH